MQTIKITITSEKPANIVLKECQPEHKKRESNSIKKLATAVGLTNAKGGVEIAR